MDWSAAASSIWPMNAGTNARFCAGWRAIGGTGACPRFRSRPAAQVFFCIDEREESIRRALEEADPEVETFSSAGYFGVAVDYKGIDDPHGAAFCPVVVKPRHAVIEQSKAEDSGLLEKRRWRRRLLGRLMQYSFLSSRSLLRGWLSTAALGLLSSVPLIGSSAGAAALRPTA